VLLLRRSLHSSVTPQPKTLISSSSKFHITSNKAKSLIFTGSYRLGDLPLVVRYSKDTTKTPGDNGIIIITRLSIPVQLTVYEPILDIAPLCAFGAVYDSPLQLFSPLNRNNPGITATKP
jgi:hypothetical protein